MKRREERAVYRGLPGRVLDHLCDLPAGEYRTAYEAAKAMGASRVAVALAAKQLVELGLAVATLKENGKPGVVPAAYAASDTGRNWWEHAGEAMAYGL
jgi:hypothetical protein